MNVPQKDFADLLDPYRPNVVAKAVGVTGDTVRLWRARKSSPAVDKIPALAEFLRIDVEDVVSAIAAQRSAAA